MGTSRSWLSHAVLLATGFGLGVGFAVTRPSNAQTPPPAAKPEYLPYRGLDAALYVQTAAEYRACCLQAFALATERVKQFKDASKGAGKPLAVVLDLDETVFDNGAFQAEQLRGGSDYDPRAWDAWEENSGQIELVHGAKAFIQSAESAGVVPIYVSNRNDRNRQTVRKALSRLGIPVSDDGQLKLATRTSDKTERRQEVEKAYTVLLYVGDNLRDFDDAYRFADLSRAGGPELDAAIKARKERVDADRASWGGKWIILPNPEYGEWAKPLGRGRDDLDRLAKPQR